MRRTPRTLRLLSTSTALAVAAALVPLSAGAATATAPDDRSTVTVSRAGGGVTVGDTAVSSTAFVPLERSVARATTWPVGGGRADLTQHSIPTPTGAAAQQLSSAKLRFYRARGGYIEAAVRLRGTPDASTASQVLLAFGTVSADRTSCNSPTGGNIYFSSVDDNAHDNPVYKGTSIQVRPLRLTAARTASWNCAFAKTAPDATFASPYDSLGGDSTLFRQKPMLAVKVSRKKISSQAFTSIPVVIANSADTVATAYGTRLKITGRGLSYRFDPAVGTIRPGASRRGVIKLKYTTRRTGYFVITLRSGDYVTKVKYTVTPA